MSVRSIYQMEPRLLKHPETNAALRCDCGGGAFRVGLIVDAVGNNFINVMECVVPECAKQFPVPDFSHWPRVTCMPFRPPRLPDVRVACPNAPCEHGELCRVLGMCLDRDRPKAKVG
jgi:hypothetical protein